MSDSPRFASLSLPRLLILSSVVMIIAGLGFVFIRHLIDFPVYYAAGRSLISGRTDLYAPDFARGPTMDYRYPPLFLISLIPLWHLPYGAAAYLWYLVGLAAIAVCCWAVNQALQQDRTGPESCYIMARNGLMKMQKRETPEWHHIRVLGLTLLGVAQYYVMALHYGNAQLLVTALLLLAAALAMGRRNLAPGILLAVAITIKITPALFLGYFALKRRWKVVIITLGVLVALNLAPAAYFGFTRNADLIRNWYRHVVEDQEFHEVNGPVNLSLKGQLVRSLTRVDYSHRIDGDTRYPSINLADYSYRGIGRLWLLLDVLLLLLGVAFISLASRTQERSWPWPEAANARSQLIEGGATQEAEAMRARPNPEAVAASCATKAGAPGEMLEIGIMLCLMLLVEPLTSKIYFIALIWPLAVLLDLVLTVPETVPRPIRWGAMAVVILNVVLPLLPGPSVQRFLLVFGVDFYLTVLILAMLVWVFLAGRQGSLRYHRPRRSPPS